MTEPHTPSRRLVLGFGALLFLTAFIVRVLFWLATPDAAWPYSAWYKGDTPLWMEYARALASGGTFEFGLPLRPPGMAYVLRALWDGTPQGMVALKWLWCALGALVPCLFFFTVRRAFGTAVAAVGGALLAASTGLFILSTSLNNETLYLVLVLAGLLAADRFLEHPRWLTAAAWGAVNGAACLVRVEHVLYVALCLVLYVLVPGGRRVRALGRTAVALAAFAVVLIPWQASAWKAIHAYNTTRQFVDAGPEDSIRQIEDFTQYLTWTPGAEARRDALPVSARHYWTALVAATVSFRGDFTVRAEDFDILRDAFGTYPEPIRGRPFVALYGPLNFVMANVANASGGFRRDALDAPPPLAGGADRYPPFMSRDFPPEGDFVPWYPPHLAYLNHGYALGWRWIRAHPAAFAVNVTRKLDRFWAGATYGATGYGFPAGMEGGRFRVDAAISASRFRFYTWRILVTTVCLLGWLLYRRRREIAPWSLFALTHLVVAVLFFGYARSGAMIIPVLALFAALAAVRIVPLSPRRGMVVAVVLLTLAGGAETVRFLHPPALFLNRRPVGPVDPWPKLFVDHTLQVEY
jgi:hypothetical protein